MFAGIKVAVAREDGLGHLIVASTSQARTPPAFVALVLLTATASCSTAAPLTERIAVPWAPRNGRHHDCIRVSMTRAEHLRINHPSQK